MTGRVQERAEALIGKVPLGGPADEFERVGRLQLETLVHEGLDPSSKLLDVGCGALRGGYWTIHFLDPGCYFGIEPYREMLEAGLTHILEPGLVEAKGPAFLFNDDFDFSGFGVQFDFFVARSIWTHATAEQIATMLDGFCAARAPGGVLLASYFRHLPPGLDLFRLYGSVALSYREALFDRYPKLRDEVRSRFGQRWSGDAESVPEYGNDNSLPVKMIPHTLESIRQLCRERGLQARELGYGVANSQRWLRIESA